MQIGWCNSLLCCLICIATTTDRTPSSLMLMEDREGGVPSATVRITLLLLPPPSPESSSESGGDRGRDKGRRARGVLFGQRWMGLLLPWCWQTGISRKIIYKITHSYKYHIFKGWNPCFLMGYLLSRDISSTFQIPLEILLWVLLPLDFKQMVNGERTLLMVNTWFLPRGVWLSLCWLQLPNKQASFYSALQRVG